MALLSECTLSNLLLGEKPCGDTAVPLTVTSVDWDGDGHAGNGLSHQATRVSIARGVDVRTGTFQPGTMTLELDNADKRFSPRYATSPLYPSVRPGPFIRHQRQDQLTTGGTLQGQFAGYLRNITANPGEKGQIVSFECVDLADRLGRTYISTPLYQAYRSDELIAAILALAGWTGSTALETGAKTFAYASWRRVTALQAIQDVVNSELGLFFISAAGVPTFHNRYHRVLAGAAVATLGTTTANAPNGLQTRYSLDDIYNEAQITVYPRQVGEAGGVLWTWDESPRLLAAGETVTIEAEFSDPDLARACEGDDVITPVADTDYTANSASDGLDTDKTDELTVTFTAYGRFAALSITNDDAAAVYVTLFQIRGTPIVTFNPVTVTQANATSIATYGFTRTLALNQPLETSTDSARDAAAFLVERYGTELDRIDFSLEFVSEDFADAMAVLELNDRIALTNAAAGYTAGAFFIDSIRHGLVMPFPNQASGYSASPGADLDLIILDSETQTFDDLLGY